MEWNRHSRNKPLHQGQMIFNKVPRLYNGERTISLTNGTGETGQAYAKEQCWTLMSYIKTNSKWIKDLNVRAKTLKIIEESISVNPCDLGLGNGFLDMIPKAQATEVKIDKLDFIKNKNFCASKNTINKVKSQPNRLRVNICSSYI